MRATDHGDYVLIAGERRYRAAVKACVMELPAIIRPAGNGDEDEHSDLLVEALLENDLRRDLDPVEPGGIALDATLSASAGCYGA